VNGDARAGEQAAVIGAGARARGLPRVGRVHRAVLECYSRIRPT